MRAKEKGFATRVIPFLPWIWLILLMTGFVLLYRYSYTPGYKPLTSIKWPFQSKIPVRPGERSLVVIAHPECPCTRATLGELERLVPYIGGKVKIYILFFIAKRFREQWINSELVSFARTIPKTTVLFDEEGIEARYFGAQTSGHVFLYGLDGHLEFQGGITIGRGHMGENPGKNAIVEFVKSGATAVSKTPVFGCSIRRTVNPAQKGG